MNNSVLLCFSNKIIANILLISFLKQQKKAMRIDVNLFGLFITCVNKFNLHDKL